MTTETEIELERLTTQIARSHGCDRGTFTVCWGELEKGLVCLCKEEARAVLVSLRSGHALSGALPRLAALSLSPIAPEGEPTP